MEEQQATKVQNTIPSKHCNKKNGTYLDPHPLQVVGEQTQGRGTENRTQRSLHQNEDVSPIQESQNPRAKRLICKAGD